MSDNLTMLCKKPFMKDGMPFGCGQCLPCRVKKRREWTNRIVLESLAHEHSAFVTLTYNEENLPQGGTLVPSHLKAWQDSISYHSGLQLRFFGVGEYGEQTKRPHYHAAVFGLPGCANLDIKCPCSSCETLRRSWSLGHVYNGTLTKDSAAYVAGYTTKKMTDRKPEEKYEKLLKKDPDIAAEYKKRVLDYLEGRHPEFARMSNGGGKSKIKGGIGYPALPAIRDVLETEHGCDLMAEIKDVPELIQMGGRQFLLGRYLKNKLRDMMGVPDEWKENKLSQLQKERIQEYITYTEEFTSKETFKNRLSQKDFLIEKNTQAVRDLEKRYGIKHNQSKGVI